MSKRSDDVTKGILIAVLDIFAIIVLIAYFIGS